MHGYKYSYSCKSAAPKKPTVKVGVAGSGNLEVIVRSTDQAEVSEFAVSTIVDGFEETWKAVIDRFAEDFPVGGLSYNIRDAGATPPVVSLRLRQAFETYLSCYHRGKHYLELDARERIYALADDNSFQEFLLDDDCSSPNLPNLKMQTEDDDGVVVGTALIKGKKIAIASQQKDFIGGAIGEVHGAKINGLVKYAIKKKVEAIVLLIDSGGVRLQEANVGEIEISEIVRSLLDARFSGIKTIGVVCGKNGAFGGMGIISGVLDSLIVNLFARIGVSGAEVIQAVKGVEAFDAKNRPLMWRVYGGRTRFMQRAAQFYVSSEILDISSAIMKAINQLDANKLIGFETLQEEQKDLKNRIESAGKCAEEGEWLKMKFPNQSQEDFFGGEDEKFLSLVKTLKLNS